MKSIQYFSDDYLKECRRLTPQEIARFLEDFRLLHGAKKKTKSKLISLKVEESLLNAFRTKANLKGIPYQTQIKKLMEGYSRG